VFTSLRLDAVRFSPHLYNDETDVQRALDVLGDILAGPTGRAVPGPTPE
jgi:selenocysteine lyase/cysteine desulfurase